MFLKNVGKIDPDIVRMVGESIIDCEVLNETSGLGLIFTFSVFVDKKVECVRMKPLTCEMIAIQEKS